MPSDRTTLSRPFATSLPYGVYPSRQFFDGDTDPTDPKPAPTKPNETPGDPATLGDAGKAAIERERQARRDEEKARKAAEKELADLKAERQKQADEDAARQGEWQKLAEQRQAELDKVKADADKRVADAQAEVARRDRDDRARAALKAEKLDESLLPRLRGDTADELNADAKELAKLFRAAAPSAGNGPNPEATGTATDKADADALAAHKAAFTF